MALLTKPRSAAQREAARRNLPKSRGPVTPEGKARSSRNHVKHGLSRLPVNPDDLRGDPEFERIVSVATRMLNPQSPGEENLARQYALAEYRLRAVSRAISERIARAAQDYRAANPTRAVIAGEGPVIRHLVDENGGLKELYRLEATAARAANRLRKLLNAFHDRRRRLSSVFSVFEMQNFNKTNDLLPKSEPAKTRLKPGETRPEPA